MKSRFAISMIVATVLAVFACLVGMSIGAVYKSLPDVALGVISGDALYWRYRLPRILVGAIAGVGMAVSGSLLQIALRNPLAAPDTLGITAGGGLAAVCALLGFGALPAAALTPIALVGSLVGAGLVFVVGGRSILQPARLALTGVAVTAGLGALTQLLLVRAAPDAGAAMAWLKGSLYARSFSDAVIAAPVVGIGLLIAIALSSHFNALALSDASMAGVGVPTTALRVIAIGAAILSGAAAVAAAGVLGFVGLIVPHAARLLVGQSLSRLIPLASVGSVAVVVGADAVARWAFAPTEIPVGALIAIVGAPYFIYLVLSLTKVRA